jgi:hypothetical protein
VQAGALERRMNLNLKCPADEGVEDAFWCAAAVKQQVNPAIA